MKFDDLKRLLNGETIKIKKNQIYYDERGEYFVVEKFEFVNAKGEDMFSVVDGYVNIEDAIYQAKIAKPDC